MPEKMNIEYLDGSTILTYTLDEKDEIDYLSSEMLKNKDLKEFLPMSFTRMDTQRNLNYDITGLTSIHEIFMEGGTFKKLFNIFSGIIDSLNMVDEYMLVKDSILLDDNYIFADGDYATKMVCLPIKNISNNNPDIRRFFKNILIDYLFEENENQPYIRRVAAFLNSDEFNLDGLKKLLKLIQTENMGRKSVAQQQQIIAQPVSEPLKEDVKPVIRNDDNDKKEDVPVHFEYELDYAKDLNFDSDKEEKNDRTDAEGEEKMSLMYLLHNFSGENLKKYKEGNKKGDPSAKKSKPEKKKKEEKASKKDKKSKTALEMNFAKPGKEEHLEMNFAIPGREEKKSQTDVMPIVDEAEKNAQELLDQARYQYEQQMKKENDVPVKEGLYSNYHNDNFDETIVLDDGFDDEATVVLAENKNINQRPTAYLIRKRTNEKIYIKSDSFSLGKQSSEVDYCIPNNATISRCHCYIKYENGTFYVMDNNAKNFTYVNGDKLESRGKSPIKTGDTIKLSNENFEFVID